jgi:hypothetical protein
METIKIENKLIRFRILPRFGRVYAEIFYTTPDNSDNERYLVEKMFGGLFRPINETDYSNARQWCLQHLESIKKSNM